MILFPGKRSGFTLIEMLVVLAILGLLMAIMLPGLKDAQRRAKERLAHTEVAAFKAAIVGCYQAYGQFPTTQKENARWVAILTAKDSSLNPREIIFMNIPKRKLNSSGQMVDPWSNAYIIADLEPFEPDTATMADEEVYTMRVYFENRRGHE